MDRVSYAFTLFLNLLVEALPFLLLGVFISSCLLVFVDEHQLVARLPRNRILGAIVGSSLGLLLPGCQYGNIPIARRLLIQGVPISVAIGFLVASPTINPIVLWLTWQTFADRPKIILFRVLFAWAIAIIIACVFSTYREKPLDSDRDLPHLVTRSTLIKSGTWLLPSSDRQPLHRVGNLIYEYKSATIADKPLPLALTILVENAIRELLELGSWLVCGCAIAAAIQVIFPQGQLLSWGQNPVTQILAMLGWGFTVSLGSTADFTFSAWLPSNFSSGSLLAFLLLGSIVDLKAICLMLSTFRLRSIVYLVILASQLTFLLSLLVDFYLN